MKSVKNKGGITAKPVMSKLEQTVKTVSQDSVLHQLPGQKIPQKQPVMTMDTAGAGCESCDDVA